MMTPLQQLLLMQLGAMDPGKVQTGWRETSPESVGPGGVTPAVIRPTFGQSLASIPGMSAGPDPMGIFRQPAPFGAEMALFNPAPIETAQERAMRFLRGEGK